MGMKKITVINLGPIGDVINSGPVCIELKRKYPDSELLFITIPESLTVAKSIPGVDRVIVYDKKAEHKGLLNLAKFAIPFGLREKIELAVVLNETFRSALLSFLLGAKKRIGRNSQGRGILLTNTIPFTDEEKALGIHVTEQYMRVLKLINLYNSEQKMGFNYSAGDMEFINGFLAAKGLHDSCLIGLCPCANIENRDWKPEEAAKFIKFINQNKDQKVIIIGAEMAKAFAEKLKELGSDDFVDMTCKTTIPQLAALISKFKTLVSVDTGPMHLGLALNIPTISMFMQSNQLKWGPKDQVKNRLLFKPGKLTTGEEVIESYVDLVEKLKL